MPNAHLVDQENCLAREMKSQTGDTHWVSRRFPSRSYRLQFLRIKITVYIHIYIYIYYIHIYIYIYIHIYIYKSRNKNISDGTPYMHRNQMRRFHATYGNPSRWKATVQDMTEMANAAQNKWTSCPNIQENEMFFLERLKLVFSSKLKYALALFSPYILCSLSLRTVCVFVKCQSSHFDSFTRFKSACHSIIN